jgi:hypothetical protein
MRNATHPSNAATLIPTKWLEPSDAKPAEERPKDADKGA